MKRAFMIDLNVFRFAATLKNEKDNDDDSAQQLLINILKLCNTLVIPKEHINKYIKLMSKLADGNEFFDTEFWGLWRNYWTTEGKIAPEYDEPSVLEEEGKFHDDDIDFIRLAVKLDKGIVFSTTDNRLINKINNLGMTSKYGFEILRPEDAIKYVGDKD